MNYKKLLPASKSARNVIVLMTGTGLAQAISIGVSPILSRLYSPSDFGAFALYLSIVSIIGVIATGRYEMAIMLPKENDEVTKIISVIIILSLIVSSLTFLIVYIFNESLTKLLGNPLISSWLYVIPLSILINSVYQTLNYVLIRNKLFKKLANNKVFHSASTSSTQVAFGTIGMGGKGFLLSAILSYIFSIYLILRNVEVLQSLKNISFKNLKPTIVKYKQFPMYDVPSMAVNLGASQLPILALGKLFSLSSAGLYSFTFKILSAPLTLLSNTVLDVFKQKANEDYHQTGSCEIIFFKTFKNLLLLAIVPFLLLGFFSPQIFSFCFGKQWQVAGVYAQILTPMFFLKFISSPLSYVFTIHNKQHINLIGQITLLLFILLAFGVGSFYKSEMVALALFSLSYSCVYLVYLFFSYRLSLGLNKELTK